MKITTTPFLVSYLHHGIPKYAEIHPCCDQLDVVDYGVYEGGQLAFTITRNAKDNTRWIVALKNADDNIDEEIVQSIGKEIDARIISGSW